jgi:nuclear migration protein JNM1
VLPTLSRLEALLSLLSQPRHLDSLQRRLNLLLPVLEKASSARKALDGGVGPPLATLSAGAAAADETRSSSSTGLPEEQLQRLARLFPVLERVEPMLPLVPALLSRLQSLASLHAAASSVIADLAALQHAQTHASTQHNEMAELLKGVAESMRNNQQTVKANLEALEQRLESLDERVAKLGS